ncbi:uncharacterized protein LOC118465053 [Anopheles albimanus]|uniref:Uncharacterized protein n=1 Tax=Anopheles albimanus TaxID=7167 RepID=A0A182FJD1_ANOAL|nr:uncharacterized protein LOC118465053 [Anopheles albimanus]
MPYGNVEQRLAPARKRNDTAALLSMEQLEREIRKEIDEMNTSVSLVDRLEAGDTMDEERREELLSSTRAAFDSNVNTNNVKNSLTDSQISIISKHDGYLDSGHFYSTPAADKEPTGDGGGTVNLTFDPSGEESLVHGAASLDAASALRGSTRKDRGADEPKQAGEKATGKQKASAKQSTGKQSTTKQTTMTSSMAKGQQQHQPPGGGGTSTSLANLLFANNADAGGAAPKRTSKLPSTIGLGLVQLVLSVMLAALGGLVIARNASLAMAGTGLWCGAIAGIAGSLGLMNIKMAKTGFLAVNLICVASSTLGLALAGIGAVRDANMAQQDEQIWGAVTAGTGLLVTLAIHFLVSVFSVYYSALKLCSRPSQKHQMLDNVMHSNSQAFMTQQKVEDYINSLRMEPGIKDMMYQTMLKRSCGSMYGEKHRLGDSNYSNGNSHRLMLVPAGAGNGLPSMIPMYPGVQSGSPNNSSLMYPPNLIPHGLPQYQPYPESALMEAQISRANRKRSTMRMNHERNSAEVERPRRKSDSDLEKTFTYTGLDRDIADSYLAKEEEKLTSSIISNSGHHPTPPHTYHHDLMLIDHRTNFEQYNGINM